MDIEHSFVRYGASAYVAGKVTTGTIDFAKASGSAVQRFIASAGGAAESEAVPKYASQVRLGDYLAAKAPMQVQPGTRVLTGQYIESTGAAPRVQPWTAHYDKYGRIIARTDYNAGNAAAGIPDTHYATYGYNNGVPYTIQNHVPGEYKP